MSGKKASLPQAVETVVPSKGGSKKSLNKPKVVPKPKTKNKKTQTDIKPVVLESSPDIVVFDDKDTQAEDLLLEIYEKVNKYLKKNINQ